MLSLLLLPDNASPWKETLEEPISYSVNMVTLMV